MIKTTYRLLAIGYWLLAIGYWLSATGYWLSATGYRLLAIGYWLLAIGYWLSATGYWLLATGYWLLAIGYWLLAIGYWLLAIGYWPLAVILLSVSPDPISIFQHEYRALRPRAPMPPIHVRFRRFTSLNTTIRLREGEIFVSLSDLLEGAPDSVLHAIAHILFAKLYDKRKLDPAQELRYKRFSSSASVVRQTELIRHARGSKRYFGPEGRFYQSR